MIEAVWYGLIAALTFIGFVSVVCLTIMHFYKPKGSGNYILTIPENVSCDEIERLVCGAHLRRIIFGDLICDDVVVAYSGLNEECCQAVARSATEYGLRCISGKENDGSGAC